jgi:hypothetical protein
MEDTKNSSDPSPDQTSHTFKQHYAGTFVGERQIKQAQSINNTDDSAQSTKEPNNPLEKVMRLWNFIKDPNHSGAVIAILTLVIALSNAGYDVVASCQLKSMNSQLQEMRQQTTLTRQQLVGTQGAVLQWDIHSPDGSTRGVVGGIRNAGVVTATGVHIQVQVTRQTISADGNIEETGQPVRFDDTPDRIKGGSGVWPESYPHIWPVPWMSTTDPSNVRTSWPSDWPGRDATVVNAHVTYDNGFGDNAVSDLCVEFLPIFYIKSRVGTTTIGGAYACDSVRDGVPEARKKWEKIKP